MEKSESRKAWKELKDTVIAGRKLDGERYLAKAFELAADGDHEAAERFFGYAMYQVERIFTARKGFKLEAK